MRRPAIVLAATLAIAGCAETEALRGYVARELAPPPPPPPAAAPRSDEPTPVERAAAALGRQPGGDAVAALPPPGVGPDPTRLAGMVPAQLTDLLGKPTLRRREKAAEVWMYSSRLCTLHLFLYPGADGSALGVKHYEMRRPNSTTPVAPRDCLDSVIVAKKPRPS